MQAKISNNYWLVEIFQTVRLNLIYKIYKKMIHKGCMSKNQYLNKAICSSLNRTFNQILDWIVELRTYK